jgi:glyoxylase-like metal-dependent hydrolase (beta-lactamase superfamily II)
VRWDEVGDGCFRRRYQRFDLNIGVVRGSDSLLVVDTRADLRQADELLDDLRTFGQPIRWVVNSHWHFDHVFGNQRFVERAGGAVFESEAAEVSADLEMWGHADLPGMLLDKEAELRASLRSFYGDDAGDEYDRVALTPPDRLIANREVLDIGDRSVELAHFGLGHTSNDLVVVVPDGGVIFAGDLLEQSGPPAYGDDSYPLAWPTTVDALIEVGASTFVPGHGDVMSPSSAAEQARDIATVAALIRELHAAGVAVGDAVSQAGDRWPFPADALLDAVQRGYEALDSTESPSAGAPIDVASLQRPLPGRS